MDGAAPAPFAQGLAHFISGRWSVDGSESVASATGQEFTRALLHVLLGKESTTKTAREAKYRDILKEDIEEANTGVEKGAFTYRLFSLFENDPDLKPEVVAYGDSASGNVLTIKGLPPQSAIYEYPNLHRETCHRFCFVPIHQQLINSFFSKFETCSRSTDTRG